jgi:hypothetical protein
MSDGDVMLACVRDYLKVEALRKSKPEAIRTSRLIELAGVNRDNYYRGRRAYLDGKLTDGRRKARTLAHSSGVAGD